MKFSSKSNMTNQCWIWKKIQAAKAIGRTYPLQHARHLTDPGPGQRSRKRTVKAQERPEADITRFRPQRANSTVPILVFGSNLGAALQPDLNILTVRELARLACPIPSRE